MPSIAAVVTVIVAGRRLLAPRLAFLLALAGLLSACATAQQPDPLEAMNRKTFAFNETLDVAVLKPVATTYKKVVPEPVRTGVTNFFLNLNDPWSGVNLMLQGRLKDGVSDLARFATNTTVGLLGTRDVATDWGMPRHGVNFGDTLGAWGVGGGAYVVLPLFGPSDLRGVAAFPVNSVASPQSAIADAGLSMTLMAVNLADKRASLLEFTQLIDQVALDKYLFMRDAYFQRRADRERGAVGAAPDAAADESPEKL